MIVTTTPTIEGKMINSYKDVVFGESIIGANIFKDFMAGIRDIVGGRSGAYERVLIEARENALREMENRASRMGANAIVGIHFDYEILGAKNGMMMVTCSGTAVMVS